MAERTKYQERIIRNFYENREAISLQRAQELVTELYLAEGKKRAKYWEQLAVHLQKLGVGQETIDHLITQGKPELVATLIKKLMDKKG
jgi:hypothetical protein